MARARGSRRCPPPRPRRGYLAPRPRDRPPARGAARLEASLQLAEARRQGGDLPGVRALLDDVADGAAGAGAPALAVRARVLRAWLDGTGSVADVAPEPAADDETLSLLWGLRLDRAFDAGRMADAREAAGAVMRHAAAAGDPWLVARRARTVLVDLARGRRHASAGGHRPLPRHAFGRGTRPAPGGRGARRDGEARGDGRRPRGGAPARRRRAGDRRGSRAVSPGVRRGGDRGGGRGPRRITGRRPARCATPSPSPGRPATAPSLPDFTWHSRRRCCDRVAPPTQPVRSRPPRLRAPGSGSVEAGSGWRARERHSRRTW